ncbi:inositol monophosphatase [Candidatus Peregrinibacteria bacterium]|jgi:myo-inositol-1(or 4)-monophosphatase|nr:inositol monophosphatase [Candidatus Peregrinibacteria bacterium]
MKILDFAIQTAEKAGKLILKQEKETLQIDEKTNNNDLVTNVDKASEALIIKEIQKEYPSHAILAEESANLENQAEKYAQAKYIWIIDPIDGTTNFAHGLPLYSVSIGVFKTESKESSKNFEYITGELVAGVVHAPRLRETFSAYKGKGARLNGKKIHVSKRTPIKNCLTVTGFPTKDRERNLPYFQAMLSDCRAVRRLGSAALDLCYIACGRFDAYWEFGLKPWDVAAGSLIVEEAGGKATDTYGETLDLFGQDILATNGLVHKEVITKFKKL